MVHALVCCAWAAVQASVACWTWASWTVSCATATPAAFWASASWIVLLTYFSSADRYSPSRVAGLLGELLGAREQHLEVVGGGLADRIAAADGLGAGQAGDVTVLPDLGKLIPGPGFEHGELRDRERRIPGWTASPARTGGG